MIASSSSSSSDSGSEESAADSVGISEVLSVLGSSELLSVLITSELLSDLSAFFGTGIVSLNDGTPVEDVAGEIRPAPSPDMDGLAKWKSMEKLECGVLEESTDWVSVLSSSVSVIVMTLFFVLTL